MKLNRTGSIWNRENRNGINTNWDRLEGIMKSIDDLVVKGKLSSSEYAQLIKELNSLISHGDVSVHDIDKNKGLLDQSFLSEELLEQISGSAPVLSTLANGTVTSNKVAPKAITPSRTSFFDRGNNLFDGIYVNGWLGRTIELGVTELSTRKNNSESNGKSAIVPVKPNATYTLIIGDGADVWRFGTTADYPDFETDGHATENILEQTLNIESAFTTRTFETNGNANYLVVNPSQTGAMPDLAIVEGGNPALLEEPQIPKRYLDLGNSLHPFSFEGGMILTSGEVLRRYEHVRAVIHERIKLSPGYIVGLHDYSVYEILVVRWDRNGNYLSSYPERTTHVKIKDGYEFVIAVARRDGAVIRVNEFEEIGSLLFIEYAGGEASGGQTNVNSKYYLTDDINHEFKAFKEHSFGNAEARNTSAQDIENLFTDLSNTGNGYVKKKNLGNSVNGKPLYEITLNAHRTDSRENIPHSKPKIVIVGSLHGNEKTPAFAIYNLVNLLTHHWHESKMLEFLRFNVDFKIIPLANPDGFDSMSRMNANGINLNRDFPANWVDITGGSSNNGDAPLSQPESQIIYNWLPNHQDAVLGIDYHNSLYSESLEFACWAGTLTENNAKVMQNVISLMGRHWQLEYPQFPQDITHQFGDVRSSSNGTLTRQMTDYGIPGITLECLREVPWQDNPEIFDQLATTMALELLIYTLKHNIKLIM